MEFEKLYNEEKKKRIELEEMFLKIQISNILNAKNTFDENLTELVSAANSDLKQKNKLIESVSYISLIYKARK